MLGVLGMAVYGVIRAAQGTLPDVESADLHDHRRRRATAATSRQVAMIFLLARAFSSGCAALTGVEAISNGVPAFRKPKSKNAATTLFLLGAIAITMMLSIIILARNMGLRYVDPHDLDRLTEADGSPLPDGYDQHTVIAQIARAVFSDFPPGFYFVVAMTGIILILAANTAFNGFPVLGSILAQDGYAPRQLGSRGDRLAYSNGILILAGFAIVLIVAFDAEPTRLIQLYIVGVFVSFNLSQLGMIRHWTRHLKTENEPADAAQDVPVAGDQHLRPGDDRVGVRGRAADQVPRRRLDRDPGDDRLLRDPALDPQRTTTGSRRSWSIGDSDPIAADPGARDRAGLQAAQADDAGAGLRQGEPSQHARGGLRRHRRRERQQAPRASGTRSGSTYR